MLGFENWGLNFLGQVKKLLASEIQDYTENYLSKNMHTGIMSTSPYYTLVKENLQTNKLSIQQSFRSYTWRIIFSRYLGTMKSRKGKNWNVYVVIYVYNHTAFSVLAFS